MERRRQLPERSGGYLKPCAKLYLDRGLQRFNIDSRAGVDANEYKENKKKNVNITEGDHYNTEIQVSWYVYSR